MCIERHIQHFIYSTIAAILSVSTAPGETIDVPGDYPTIQAAIAAAADGDEIVVAPGEYAQALNLLGKRVILRSAGGPNVTFLNGAALNASIITCNSGETLQTVVSGFTIHDGRGAPNQSTCAGVGRAGGAALVRSSGLTFEVCVFRDNGFDVNSGGAIFGRDAQIEIVGCTFLRNGAEAGYGGAVSLCGTGGAGIQDCVFENNGPTGHGGALQITTSFTILNCDFRRNDAGHGGGAELHCGPGDIGRIEDCRFDDGVAAHGGGLNVTASEGGTVEIVRCTAEGNEASHGGGYLIITSEDGFIRMTECAAVGNTANFGAGFNLAAHEHSRIEMTSFEANGNVAAFGGGLTGHVSGGSTLDVSRGALIDNSAEPVTDTGINSSECYVDDGTLTQWGGGADVRVYYSGTATLSNCLFAGNSGPNAGNAHLGTCGGGTIAFASNTVVGSNSTGVHVRVAGGASAGGLAGAVRVANSIVWGNAGPQQVQVQFINAQNDPDAEASVVYSDVQGGFEGAGNINADPLFVGAAAGNYRLAAGSPAIDAAANDRVPPGVVLDLAGLPRFADDPATPDTGIGKPPLADLGAYERHGTCAGDLDSDGQIGLQDLAIQLAHFGSSGAEAADGDLDGDHDVDLQDLATLLAAFGTSC